MNDLPDLPADYTTRTAEAKAAWLAAELLGPTEYDPSTRPDPAMGSPWQMLSVAGSRRRLARTLDRSDELMEDGRPKIIHTHGAVAMVEFETEPASAFTGVLAAPPRGGAIGVVRMSLAVPPTGQRAVTPGIGLKLLVDGRPSLDLLAMNHTVGQGRDPNPFSNSFTHDLRDEHTELRPAQKVMQFFFMRLVRQPRRLLIDHFAAVDRHGVEEPDPRVPDRLVFHPHDDVATHVRGREMFDLRDLLADLPVGVRLWRVDAVGAAHDGGDLTIGRVRLTSRFTSSAGGDRLFFRHHVAPEDRLDQ